MGYNTAYEGTLNLSKKSLKSKMETKLEKSGKAYVEFNGSDLNDATVGLKDVQVQDKMKATVSYHVASQTGKLEVDATVADNINLIVSPSIPLPSDMYDCPVKLVTKHTLKSPGISTKLTIHPLASKGELEVTKSFDHDLLSKAVLTVDSQKQNAKLVLTTPTHVLLDIDHSVEITASGGLEKSPMAAECLYKASKGDLLMKLKLTSAQKGELKAEYKLDKLTAMATVPITSLNAQGLGQPMLEIKSNYDF